MTNPPKQDAGNPLVVPTTIVQFEGSTTLADDLEERIDPSQPFPEITANVKYLESCGALELLKAGARSEQSLAAVDNPLYRKLLLYFSQLHSHSPEKFGVFFPPISANTARDFLAMMYEADIQLLYPLIGLQNDKEKFDLTRQDMRMRFPEVLYFYNSLFSGLSTVETPATKQYPIAAQLLVFSPEERVFWAGVMKSVKAHEKERKDITQLYTMQDILAYAKRIAQLSREEAGYLKDMVGNPAHNISFPSHMPQSQSLVPVQSQLPGFMGWHPHDQEICEWQDNDCNGQQEEYIISEGKGGEYITMKLPDEIRSQLGKRNK